MRVNWLARSFDPNEGYGRMGRHMTAALNRLGVDTVPVTQRDSMRHADLTVAGMSASALDAIDFRQWAFTMYEVDRLPDGWASQINRVAERLIVPCPHNADVFAEAGVRIPIDVVHLGIDPQEFPICDRPTDRPYTFLALGDRGNRKGIEIAWAAFYAAFAGRDDVRLIVKMRAGNELRDILRDDTQVTIIAEDVPQMADIYAQADCMIFPSHGEGWGLPPREAAATGLPVIATAWSGLEVGIVNWGIPLHRYRLVKSSMKPEGSLWAEPDIDDLIDHMRWCVAHREEARAIGLKAARWLSANQTWDIAARQLYGLIGGYYYAISA